MNYGSVCSGIEAATQAWHPLGWTPQWFSEIEPFPCKVLAHHYPEVPNLGDMTKLLNNQTFNDKHIDLLVSGTPCQSFSVAGLRAGLDDERGNLALEFVRLLISKRPRWFLWENVPGVLSSSNGSDFAAILSAWTGRDIEPQKFGSAGIIEGPFYSIAWRVLDSQYFGVPQRRRRVFVVGHIGNDWRPSAAVLFERESLRRDFTPGGKKRKRTAPAAEGSINCSSNGITGAVTSKWAKGAQAPLLVQPMAFTQNQMGDVLTGDVMHSLGTNSNATGRNAPNVMQPAYGIQANIVDRTERSGANGLGVKEEASYSLTKNDRHATFTGALIRRLTPVECERLQGFPDGYTDIPGATDSKRYAALGNSMTVNVMQWIGKRIDDVDFLTHVIGF